MMFIDTRADIRKRLDRGAGESNRTYEAACSPTATPAATATRELAEMGFLIMIADEKGQGKGVNM